MIEIKEVPRKYRPVPFWSWNEKLNTDETRRQAQAMIQAGMGGFFMHARGGLQTPYMGEEWFDNVKAGIEAAEQGGVDAWAYDENGWPSGFGDGRVNGRGPEFQQKYLRMEEGTGNTQTTIVNTSGKHFYYELNPFYVDTLDETVICTFLEEIYQPYYERYQNRISGFFTDEPQISHNRIPWSLGLPEAYQKAYGEDLLPLLPELFEETGAYQTTRIRFWKLVTDLFSKNFFKQIYDWCEERELRLTGHLVLEDWLQSQLTSNGACMPHYEYFHIPGIDRLTREIIPGLAAVQGCSVAHQLGKKQFLTESFALCGHNISFSGLRGVLEWQMVRGVNLLCPHLEGYSLRGIRKRDYPPAMYEQQPWWPDYSRFITAMSRIGMLLAEGDVRYDTLLIHPQTTAWTLFDCRENRGLQALEAQLTDALKTLDKKHILFHLGDETIMERHARAEGDTLVIGTQRYRNVLLLPGQVLLPATRALLDAYQKGGGIVTTASAMPENPVISNPEILCTVRHFGAETLYYFVNVTGRPQSAEIPAGAKRIDCMTGDLLPFDGHWDFRAYDSVLVLDDGTERLGEEKRPRPRPRFLELAGEWQVAGGTENALTLDHCDYYFDGSLEEENGYVLNIQGRACALRRPVEIRQVYHVEANAVPKNAYLVCETPELFKITVNGRELSKKDCGFFRDRAFRKLALEDSLRTGANEIVLECRFRQSGQVYENLEKSLVFESEKNKLTYDMEIEPIYLVGGFSVDTPGKFHEISQSAVRYTGGFALGAPRTRVTLDRLEQQGFPFFSGELVLEKTFGAGEEGTHICLKRSGINAVRVQVNGGEEQVSIWDGDVLELGPWTQDGENTVRLTLVNNLHNLLGPHHLEEGECDHVGPSAFFKEACVWREAESQDWNDGYTFVKTQIQG